LTSKKSRFRKSKLVVMGKRASAIPAWVAVKTKGAVRLPRRRRQWRRSKSKF
jgi:ribosomal protein L39E